MDAVLEEMLGLALQAPSGDNMQPWALCANGAQLELRFVETLAAALLDYGDVASRLSCGALLENLELAGAARGINVVSQIDPEPTDPSLWARASLSPMEPRTSELEAAIVARVTNRGRFDGAPLSDHEVSALAAPREGASLLQIFAGKAEVAAVSKIIGEAETVRSSVRRAHEDLQQCLRWTPEEAERTRDGLDVRTLGVTATERTMLKFFAPWSRMRVLLALGGAWLQGRYARGLAGTASAFAWIGSESLETSALIDAGRVMQRVWLQATALGLDVSPFAALPLMGIMRRAAPDALTAAQRRRIDAAFAREHALRGQRPGRCLMLLRIGRGPRPEVRALRRRRAPLSPLLQTGPTDD